MSQSRRRHFWSERGDRRKKSFAESNMRFILSFETTVLMNPTTDSPAVRVTGRRLIEAAGEVFAEQGFHRATVRQITERAGANVAAINYHFRDKAELYAAVLRQCHCAANELGGPCRFDSGSPADRLRAFIDWFLQRLLHPDRPKWHGVLMAREMTEPTGALAGLIEEIVRPQAAELRRILEDLGAGGVGEERLTMLGLSIVGQCLFYVHHRPLIKALAPQFKDAPPPIGALVDHIHAFSLAGVRQTIRKHA
jgi:AcrR family transcriptional regulator